MNTKTPRSPGPARSSPFAALLTPPIVWSALVLALWFHGDTILGGTLHLLHVMIEVLEMGLEHLLEALFHLEGHEAQMWTAWIGASLLMALGYAGYRHARRRLVARFPTADAFARWSTGLAREHWGTLTLPLVLLLLSASFF